MPQCPDCGRFFDDGTDDDDCYSLCLSCRRRSDEMRDSLDDDDD